MRYFLFVLLLLFSTQGFSGEVDGKGLDCKVGKTSHMFWFNNDVWDEVFYWEAIDAMLPADEVLKKKGRTSYYTNHSTLKWGNAAMNYELNRKTLEIKLYNKLSDNEFVGSCKVFVGFDSVKKRQAELKKAIEKSKRENKI
jgi:hypothetical protein